MEAVIGDPLANDAIHRAGLHCATERRQQAGAGVIDQHEEDVGRILGKPAGLDTPFVDRLLHRAARVAGGWRGGKGSDRAWLVQKNLGGCV
jgi:hypothetical protein